MTITWTPEQSPAIETTDNSVLVSAAAGSGKTAVLTERCVQLVVPDLRAVTSKKQPCDIDELLIVTFTDAAAAEMRGRIAQRLREKLENDVSNSQSSRKRLHRQLAMLDGARISTIHSFCRWLLNRYFSFVDLEPRMPLLDEHEAAGLKRDCVKALFDDWSIEESDRGEAFLDLLSAYGKSERTLQDTITSIAAFLESHVDPDAWLQTARQQYLPSADGELLNETWRKQLVALLRQDINAMQQAITEFCQFMNRGELRRLLIDLVTPLSNALSEILATLSSHDLTTVEIEAVRGAINDLFLDSMPYKNRKPIKDMPADQIELVEGYRARFNAIKDSLKKTQAAMASFSCADWAEGIARSAPHVVALLDAVVEFRQRYSDEKRLLGMLDFSDLERFTLKLLNDETNGVAARMRDKFKHVLVDEFQDTNPVQARILQLVSRENDERANNLFSVGDVKQSIYRFRLGEPRLFLERRDKFENTPAAGTVLRLASNFRSTVNVIDAINAIFTRLMAKDLGDIDYTAGEQLAAPEIDAKPGTAPAVELHILQDPNKASATATTDENDDESGDGDELERIEREAYVIAERIIALHEAGTKYEDMAILLRSMKARMGLFLRRLQSRGIPAVATRSGDLFDALEVLDVIALLRVMDNAQQDIPLAALLRSPLLGAPLSDRDFAEIRTCATLKNTTRPFHAAVPAYVNDGPDKTLRDTLRARLSTLQYWRLAARRRPIADVLWDIYEATGYLAYVSGLETGPRRRANLMQLHDYARKFGDFQRLGLNRFLRFLETVRENGSELDAGTLPPVGDAVRIMTVHASKGLQFPVVFLAEAGKKHNMSDTYSSILQDRELGIGMMAVDLDKNIRYPTLPHRVIAESLKRDAIAEEMRVLYVALTRAKQRIVVVGTGSLVKDEERQAALECNSPLPLAVRTKASGYLTWLTQAVLTMPPGQVVWGDAAERGELFVVRQYDQAEIATWSFDAQRNEQNTPLINALSQLAPVDSFINEAPAKLDAETAGALERRVLGAYRYDALTRVPAVAAASELKRRWEHNDAEADSETVINDSPHALGTFCAGDDRDDAPNDTAETAVAHLAATPMTVREGSSPAGRIRKVFPKIFRRPSFMAGPDAQQPTQVGTWTHAFFEYADLHNDLSATGLATQLDRLITDGVLPTEARDVLDIAAIEWFFTTNVGRRMTARETNLKREWPFTLGIDPTRYDPTATQRDADDIVMVRGIVDCLFDSGAGWEVLDYKTDRVSGDELQERAALYAGQLRIYAQAVEAVWQRRPTKLWLAFLDAREMVEVEG